MEYRPPSLAHSCGNIKAEGADGRCRVIAERARVHMADSTYMNYFRHKECMFGSKDKNLTPLGGNDITKLFIFSRVYSDSHTQLRKRIILTCEP